jgi:pimeloyl-ACP methyl ester carboxylesterase
MKLDEKRIICYNTGMNEPMKPWPGLAAAGKRLAAPGADLFYYDVPAKTGRAAPALVLIHGLGDEADTWRHLLPLLAGAGFRCIAPDLPGFGRSRKKRRISLDSHAEAVLALMRETGDADAEQPAVLIGNSMGAVVAELIALKRPGLVQALVLLDGCFPLSGGLNRGLLLMGLPFIGRRWYRSFRGRSEAAWQSLYPYYHNLDALPETDRAFLRQRVIERVESVRQERAYFASLRSLNRLSMFGRAGFSSFARTCPGKVLLLWGEADQVIQPEKTAAFRGLCSDAAFETIAAAGHLPHQENPEETAARILAFLSRVPKMAQGFTSPNRL